MLKLIANKCPISSTVLRDILGRQMSEIARGGFDRLGDEALALDFVLQILIEPLRTLAEQRTAQDPAFADLVAKYRARLAETGDATVDEVMPDPQSWSAVRARIAGKAQL